MSAATLKRVLGQLADNDYPDGVEEEEDLPNDIQDAYLEIERRVEACDGSYPFLLQDPGNVLRVADDHADRRRLIYKYLLLATRLNMNDNREHAGIDGTHLFEEVSAEIARSYLGPRAESMVFGTAAGTTGFAAKVDDLCCRVGEGDRYVDRGGSGDQQKDGKLDVVLWKHFSDKKQGKFVAFGQCKTGTSYKNTLALLQPDAFCDKWILSPLALKPARMFFVAEALGIIDWFSYVKDAGLLFDRCRIVDFSKGIDSGVLDKVKAWTSAAASATELPSCPL